ncbi:MAG: hypothetical protein R3261_04645, partial [Alphaproteobacteria bacterium]|nr:hypothetical protein [Alphaproteobacteria bacterium]
ERAIALGKKYDRLAYLLVDFDLSLSYYLRAYELGSKQGYLEYAWLKIARLRKSDQSCHDFKNIFPLEGENLQNEYVYYIYGYCLYNPPKGNKEDIDLAIKYYEKTYEIAISKGIFPNIPAEYATGDLFFIYGAKKPNHALMDKWMALDTALPQDDDAFREFDQYQRRHLTYVIDAMTWYYNWVKALISNELLFVGGPRPVEGKNSIIDERFVVSSYLGFL